MGWWQFGIITVGARSDRVMRVDGSESWVPSSPNSHHPLSPNCHHNPMSLHNDRVIATFKSSGVCLGVVTVGAMTGRVKRLDGGDSDSLGVVTVAANR